MSSPVAIVMAAGKGTRMKSDLPKVLVPLGGRPMVEFVLDAIRAVGIEQAVVVVGYRADLVRETLGKHRGVEFVEQSPQLGTGHAVMVCREALKDHAGPVLILTGDTPRTRPAWGVSCAMRRGISPRSSKIKTAQPSKRAFAKLT
jgi:bifunctional UDP-N-acetylglucosamine pyrophosphorylase/glucosamine-1-phosphate N-acetyltransferase